MGILVSAPLALAMFGLAGTWVKHVAVKSAKFLSFAILLAFALDLSAPGMTDVGMARLLGVDGLPCKDDGKILLAGYTSAPGRGTIINLFVLHLEGDNLLISEPEEMASLHGKEANLQLVSLKRHKADALLPDSYR